MRVPSKQELLTDPASPNWAKEILRVSERIDPVDYINVLETLLAEARQRYGDRHSNDSPWRQASIC